VNLKKKLVLSRDVIEAPNLTEFFDSDDLNAIAGRVYRGYDNDERSRARWKRRNNAAMDLAMQIQRDKNFPWPGCANVVFPLVTIASVQFSSRSYSNLIQGTQIVRYRTSGVDKSGDETQRARRIGRHMSWQLLEEDLAWEEEHDRLLINVGIVGTAFIKTYFSDAVQHNVNELVMARDLVMNYWCKSVETCDRKSHVIPLSRNKIYEKVKEGIFAKVLDQDWFKEVPPQQPSTDPEHNSRTGTLPPEPDEDTPYDSVEQHCLLDLDKDGYAEPYIATIERSSRKMLRLVSRIEKPEDVVRVGDKATGEIQSIKAEEFFTKFGFIPAADGGIYDTGFGTLLGPLNEGVNTAINQLLDSGTMANSSGGFLGRGAKIRGGVYTFAPWEWKRVDSTGDDLRKSLVQLPVRDPSNVMFNLISLLIQYTDRLGGTVDNMVGENPGQNTKVGTMQISVEQGMTVYSSIFKRIWRSLKSEFAKNHQLNRQFLRSRVDFGDEGDYVTREDYNTNPDRIAPVADPRLMSDTQRIQQAQIIREAAMQVPGYDIEEVERNFLAALQVDSVNRLYPGIDKARPLPNPKAQVEEIKARARQMELEHDKWKFTQELMEERRMNSAKIMEIMASIEQMQAEAESEADARKLAKFEARLEVFRARNEVLDSRIKTLTEAKRSEREAQTVDDSGGTGGVEE
jgi:chaperonin GroES